MDKQKNTESQKNIRWSILFIGSIVLLFAGIIYAWSILKAPLATEFKWTPVQLSLNYTFTISFFCIGGFISGLISKSTTPKFRMIISAICLFVGFMSTSRLSARDILLLYLSYGILTGAGIGIAYNSIISVTNAWFPDKKGLCSGFLMMSFGLGSLVVGNAAGIIIQMPSVGWRNTFMILAIVIGLLLFISAFFIKWPPKGTKFPAPRGIVKNIQKTAEIKDYSALEMVKRPSFWMLFLSFTFMAAVGIVTIAFAKELFTTIGVSMSFAITMVGILSVFNGLGRLLSGAIFDKAGIVVVKFTYSTLAIIAPLLVLLALMLESYYIGIVGLCMCGLTYGFGPTSAAAFTASFYGTNNFPLNFSLMNLTLIPTSFAATIAGSIVTATGSFTTVYMILICCAIAGLTLNIFIKKP